MLNEYSFMPIAPTPWATDGYNEVAFSQNMEKAPTTQRKVKEATVGVALYQQGDSNTKDKS